MSPDLAKDFSGPQAADTLQALAELFPPSLVVTRVLLHGEQRAMVEMAVTYQGVRASASLETSRVGEDWKVSGASGGVGLAQ